MAKRKLKIIGAFAKNGQREEVKRRMWEDVTLRGEEEAKDLTKIYSMDIYTYMARKKIKVMLIGKRLLARGSGQTLTQNMRWA